MSGGRNQQQPPRCRGRVKAMAERSNEAYVATRPEDGERVAWQDEHVERCRIRSGCVQECREERGAKVAAEVGQDEAPRGQTWAKGGSNEGDPHKRAALLYVRDQRVCLYHLFHPVYTPRGLCHSSHVVSSPRCGIIRGCGIDTRSSRR